MKYRLYDTENKRYIEKDTDIENREGYSVGEYAIAPDGKVNFYETCDGGMYIEEKKGIKIELNNK